MSPLANWYANAAGYRKLGLKYDPPLQSSIETAVPRHTGCYVVYSMLTMCSGRADDLLPEESDVVLLALKRLPPKEAYDRVFRLRRAFQVYIS